VAAELTKVYEDVVPRWRPCRGCGEPSEGRGDIL